MGMLIFVKPLILKDGFHEDMNSCLLTMCFLTLPFS